MYSIARTKQQHSHVTCKRKHCKEFKKQWGTTQPPFTTHALGLKPFVTVLLKETSEVSVPFALSVRTAGWLNMSLKEIQWSVQKV